MSANHVLLWMMIAAAGTLIALGICLAAIMFIYRREVNWKYVLFGIRQ